MHIIISEAAKNDLERFDRQLQRFFVKHIDKLAAMPPRRHLKLGLPYFVEDVTRQARIVYKVEDETILIGRCFVTHKDYEKWLRSQL